MSGLTDRTNEPLFGVLAELRRREAGTPGPVSSAPSRSPMSARARPRGPAGPDTRPGRRRARLFLLLPALALLLGAHGLFSAPAAAEPAFRLSDLSLSAGGQNITLNVLRRDPGTPPGPAKAWSATVPRDTTSVTITPTWTTSGLTVTVRSKEPYSGKEITAPQSVTSGGSVSVDLAPGLRYNTAGTEHRTQVEILMTGRRSDGLPWRGGGVLTIYKGGPISASLSVSPNPVLEDDGTDTGGVPKATVTVTLSAPWDGERDVVIPLTGTHGTSEAGDWGFESQNITIRRGHSTGTARIFVWPDDDSDDETMTVGLGTLPRGARQFARATELTAGTPNSVTLTITDDDGAGGQQQQSGAGGQQQQSGAGGDGDGGILELVDGSGGDGGTLELVDGSGPRQTDRPPVTVHRYAALVAQMREWRNDPKWVHAKDHTDRWDRALKAFGETVADASLTAMTAAEAQGYADRGWTRWVEVAEALRQIESDGVQAAAPEPPVVTVTAGGAVTEGAPAGFTLTAAPAPASDLGVTVTVGQTGVFAQASALGARTVTIPAGGTSAAFTVATVDDAADEPDGSVTATLGSGAGYTLGAAKRAQVTVADDDQPPVTAAAIVTKRSTAREGSDAAVRFAVRLEPTAPHTVTVDYATADGAGRWAGTAPARAGADYTATSGTLTFAPGQAWKFVEVPVLDDSIDEGTEYFLLRFSNPQGATLAAGERETQGLIRNSDPLQAMWLARFGRMVASDAVASVTARLETPRDAGSHVTFAGQRMNFGEAEGGGGAALATVLTGLAQTFGAPGAPAADDDDPFARHGLTDRWNDPATSTARSMTGRELLMGTSFRAVLGSGGGPQWTSWGQGASVSRFSAAVPGLGLTGEAATGSMGMDYEHGRLLTGFAMTHSVGEGTAQDAGWRYALGSTATMAMPYARLALSDRVSAWGLAGTGTGRLTLDLDGAVPQSYRTDLSMTLAAVGMRGDLLAPTAPGEFALALKADAFWVRTESEAVTASEFGNLAGARGESSRVRALLDGSRTFALAGGAALTPKLELGVRHDGGDAETGTGLEFGAGLGYADPSRGLDMALRVHGLAAHAENDYREWGVSGQLRLVPGDAGRGLSMSLTPSYGVDPGGSERLWTLPDAHALSANDEAAPSNRLDTEFGYGLPVFGDRFTGTPNVGFGLSETARDWRLGWRLTPAAPNASGLEVNLDAVRREPANDNGAEHGVMLRSLLRW